MRSEPAAGIAQPELERELPLHDPQRLGALLASLEPRLRSVALRITRQPEAARDVVQNAFEKVLRHGARFEGQSRVSTWLHRIVANEALMWLRAQRRRSEVPGDFDPALLDRFPDTGPTPAECADRRQRSARLHAALGNLREEERDVLLRCALREESHADYCARTGLHPGAVKTRAFRARRSLRHALQGD